MSNLLKKITSLVAVLLVISMCFTSFAYAAEVSISGEVTVEVIDEEEGLYEVIVPYTASNMGSFGVTLLAFAKGNAEGSAWTAATAPGKYAEKMKIVRVDQIGLAELSNVAKFKISTKSGDGISMVKGETGVILLGGDGVSNLAKATFTVPGKSIITGDINGDGCVDIDDAILLFNHSMMPDLFEISYTGNIDFNKDGKVNIDDAILLFNYSMMPDLFPIE
ncbi:MAG: dockerin type I repeat-containing protein [Clostridia bacterium]|nr:dockerin type I repeat-containing protein [Clostridia bacterium]